MHLDWSTLALQTINFAILVWLLRRFLYKPVLSMIDVRQAEVAKLYADAAAAETRAEAAVAAVEAVRTQIAAERSEALRSAAAQAEEAVAVRRTRAEEEAAAAMDAGRKVLAAERAQALAEARRLALDLGVDIAQRLLADIPTDRRAEVWLERVERHLAGLTQAQRDEIRQGLDGDGTLRVISAVPLPETVTSVFRTRLLRAVGEGTRILFDVDADLVAGVELHFPNVILRLSWRSVLASMRAEIMAHDNGAHESTG